MNESSEAPIATEKPKAKIGPDGLTKYQRYYQRHPEVKLKNRERERLRRERRRAERTKEKDFPHLLATAPQLPRNPTDDFAITTSAAISERWDYSLPQNDSSTSGRNTSDSSSSQSSPEAENDLDELFEIRNEIYEWQKDWGGVTNWKFSLDHSFGEAVAENHVDSWKDRLDQHADRGRDILHKLRAMNGVLPKEDRKIRQLWKQRLEFAEVLVQGITILDMKVSILPGLCNVENTFEKADVTMDTAFDDDPVFHFTDDEDSDSDESYRPPQE